MGEATHPWIAAILIGGAVGSLIGGLDAAFVMVDLSNFRRTPHQSVSLDSSSAFRWAVSFLKERITKAHLGALVRVVMVAVSLAITAPFLAQLLFSRDIADRRQHANDTALASARAALVNKYQQEQELLRMRLRGLEDARSREIAGRGLSKRYGTGPVAKSLAEQVSTINRQIDGSEHQEAADLARFDHADPETLARQFRVALTSDGIVARFEALGEMETIPGFRWAENAFRILLAGFFFGLLIFKWYEPKALEIYYDEELQGAFDDFCAGRYDEFLVDPKATPPDRVSPFWFERWYYGSAKLRKQAEALRERLATITARQTSFESAASQLAGDPGTEMQELQGRRAEILKELEPLRAALQKENDEADLLAVEISQCELELTDVPAAIEALPGIRDAAAIIAKKNYWEERLRGAKVSQRKQSPILAEAQRLYDSKGAELNTLDALIATSGRTLAELTNSIIDARLKSVHDLSAAHQEG